MMDMPDLPTTRPNLRKLELKAAELRLAALETALAGGKGHIPPAFSWAEIAVALFYAGVLQIRPTEPRWSERDRFILSKGHGCLTLYAVLADLGYLDAAELSRFAGKGSLLPGHPDTLIPGVETCSGSLGHGLGVGAGMALAGRLDDAPWRVFVLLGDGECNEGSIWEAAMFAGHQRLHNLVAIVDRNRLGATDFTENSLSLEPLAARFRDFGWEVLECDGHSIGVLADQLDKARSRREGKPFALIANTIKGKSVPFMENSPLWHHRMPKGKEIDVARDTLRSIIAGLQGG
jgi:transketolase